MDDNNSLVSLNQNDEATWRELIVLTGSPERATAVMKVLQDGRRETTKDPITLIQQKLYLYLVSGKPIISQRQLARDAGFDHPQKMLSALGALVVKGYVIGRTK